MRSRCCRAADDPGRLLRQGGRCSASARAGSSRSSRRSNPFLNYYAQETRMYSLVVLLSLRVSATVRPGVHRSGGAAGRRLRARGAALIYTHNWGLFAAGRLRRRAGSAAACRSGCRGATRCWATAAIGAALPAVAADAALPGQAHRGAVVAGAVARADARLRSPASPAARGPAVAVLLGVGSGIVAYLSIRGAPASRRRRADAVRPRSWAWSLVSWRSRSSSRRSRRRGRRATSRRSSAR